MEPPPHTHTHTTPNTKHEHGTHWKHDWQGEGWNAMHADWCCLQRPVASSFPRTREPHTTFSNNGAVPGNMSRGQCGATLTYTMTMPPPLPPKDHAPKEPPHENTLGLQYRRRGERTAHDG